MLSTENICHENICSPLILSESMWASKLAFNWFESRKYSESKFELDQWWGYHLWPVTQKLFQLLAYSKATSFFRGAIVRQDDSCTSSNDHESKARTNQTQTQNGSFISKERQLFYACIISAASRASDTAPHPAASAAAAANHQCHVG